MSNRTKSTVSLEASASKKLHLKPKIFVNQHVAYDSKSKANLDKDIGRQTLGSSTAFDHELRRHSKVSTLKNSGAHGLHANDEAKSSIPR